MTGCSKDDEENFDYPMETLYGTWEGTGIYMESNNKWIDPSNWMYSEFQFSITFYEGGNITERVISEQAVVLIKQKAIPLLHMLMEKYI